MYKYPLFNGVDPKHPRMFMRHWDIGVMPSRRLVDHLSVARTAVLESHDRIDRHRRVSVLTHAAVFLLSTVCGRATASGEPSVNNCVGPLHVSLY